VPGEVSYRLWWMKVGTWVVEGSGGEVLLLTPEFGIGGKQALSGDESE